MFSIRLFLLHQFHFLLTFLCSQEKNTIFQSFSCDSLIFIPVFYTDAVGLDFTASSAVFGNKQWRGDGGGGIGGGGGLFETYNFLINEGKSNSTCS